MKQKKLTISYELYTSAEELPDDYSLLMEKATAVLKRSYAPYSNFTVGAAALLENGKIVTGSNQENAAFSVTNCAERVLLGTAAIQHPGQAIQAIAITYFNRNENAANTKTISPCGVCRQALAEYEVRTGGQTTFILGSSGGEVYVIKGAANLLPFGFGSDDLK